MNNRVNYTATVLKFARDALTDVQRSGDAQAISEARAAFAVASRSHGAAWTDHLRDVSLRAAGPPP